MRKPRLTRTRTTKSRVACVWSLVGRRPGRLRPAGWTRLPDQGSGTMANDRDHRREHRGADVGCQHGVDAEDRSHPRALGSAVIVTVLAAGISLLGLATYLWG